MIAATRQEIYDKYAGRCAYCGQEITLRQMQVDHIIPQRHYSEKHGCLIVAAKKFTDYGLHDTRNLNPSCSPCNHRKGACTIEEFREEIAAQVERLKRDSNQFRTALRFGLVDVTNTPVVFYFESEGT